jgi:hypothetical protein
MVDIAFSLPKRQGAGDLLSSILFHGATEPFNRVLATVFLQLMYTTKEGVTVGPLLYADDR